MTWPLTSLPPLNLRSLLDPLLCSPNCRRLVASTAFRHPLASAASLLCPTRTMSTACAPPLRPVLAATAPPKASSAPSSYFVLPHCSPLFRVLRILSVSSRLEAYLGFTHLMDCRAVSRELQRRFETAAVHWLRDQTTHQVQERRVEARRCSGQPLCSRSSPESKSPSSGDESPWLRVHAAVFRQQLDRWRVQGAQRVDDRPVAHISSFLLIDIAARCCSSLGHRGRGPRPRAVWTLSCGAAAAAAESCAIESSRWDEEGRCGARWHMRWLLSTSQFIELTARGLSHPLPLAFVAHTPVRTPPPPLC